MLVIEYRASAMVLAAYYTFDSRIESSNFKRVNWAVELNYLEATRTTKYKTTWTLSRITASKLNDELFLYFIRRLEIRLRWGVRSFLAVTEAETRAEDTMRANLHVFLHLFIVHCRVAAIYPILSSTFIKF